jgi:hypothetical protein
MLPDGSYDTITLRFGSSQDSLGRITDSILRGYQIVLSGTFLYEDTVRNIGIFILCDENRSFPGANGGVTLQNGDSADFVIGLDETLWLNSIGIRGCIMKGLVYLDSKGNLSIYDDPSGMGPAAQLCSRIRNNIFNSGSLRYRKRSSMHSSM